MSWSVRRIERIAALNKASSYLEIGVQHGQTFLNVGILHKDAVDPKFLFDTKDLETKAVRYFQQTSDEFWTGGQAKTYDIIFLDGLHTFEQTFRDFLASLSHAHRRTVWLIDDTVPSDVFSAMRTQDDCIRARGQFNLTDRQWHGDVFKIVPALHDFFPNLRYATVVGSGNPQTLVWFQPRPAFAPKFNNLEAISRLEYFDIEKIEPLFNLTSEDLAFADLSASFSQ